MIPIHAFPVINSLRRTSELFPRIIDFGKNCKLNEIYVKKLQIESDCPLSFEYKIQITKPHPEIEIKPLMADIVGL